MQLFLKFRLGSHQMPVVLGCFAGGQHVARPKIVCIHCDGVAVADLMHVIFDFPTLHALRQQYAPLLSTSTNTMQSF